MYENSSWIPPFWQYLQLSVQTFSLHAFLSASNAVSPFESVTAAFSSIKPFFGTKLCFPFLSDERFFLIFLQSIVTKQVMVFCSVVFSAVAVSFFVVVSVVVFSVVLAEVGCSVVLKADVTGTVVAAVVSASENVEETVFVESEDVSLSV